VAKKPLPKVSKPESLVEENERAKPTKFTTKANIGPDPELVTTFGLGNLKVTTAKGLKNDGKTDV
tara:strand:- start:1376 stop:1570 length:195 start_codon:yes stop_codon:yes gene_type:complete